MPKKKAQAKAKGKGKKTIQKQKQTVIVNVTKGGGGGKARARPSQPRQQQIPQVIFQQQPQQIPQQERPHTIEREDRTREHIDNILNVVQQANAIYRQQPPPQAITSTNIDVGSILTGTATLAKTGLDIYNRYARDTREAKQQEQKEERKLELPASDIPARPIVPTPRPTIPPTRPAPAPTPPPATPSQRPPVPIFPKTPSQPPRRSPIRSFQPEMPRSASTGGIRKKDISDLEIARRLEILNPNLVRPIPAPSLPAPAPAKKVPDFHIKNMLGQIEFKGAMSSARHELKRGQEIRRKANEMPSLETPKKISLGQLGARSILGVRGGEQKEESDFDFRKRASQLRREGIKLRQEGLAAIRQSAKSAPASREIPAGPIAGKRRSADYT